ncbi:MAG: hypothetical protein CFE30_03720 [Bradyrhizobium sp. PARBB1]|nr:MAG: hypothetical protein CFE30_03720 [Bradyrhizobium sp. PARBB1]PSO27832.1 hypothetical protein C7G43_07710 [Bradyrhizobium sp. MOS004]HAQ79210.1 hypothetical protein [Bradyrhizobium sp.]HAR15166.1 hypothetical protein [Bradyrhizobium sp.]HAR23255.1 hypothetical protein [Bradyrhizobium sp.]
MMLPKMLMFSHSMRPGRRGPVAGSSDEQTISRPLAERKMTIVTIGVWDGVVQFGARIVRSCTARRERFIVRPTCDEVSRPGPIRQPREVGTADTNAR